MITTAAAALLLRLIYALLFSDTPLAQFNSLPGLDMATLLGFSEWDKSTWLNKPLFVLHRFVLFFCYMAMGKSHNFMLIYIVQSLFGVAASAFVVWGTWQISKSIRAGVIAGVIYALYGPFMLYECVALQESILTHTLAIGFAVWLYYLDRRSTLAGVISGVILGLNSSGRPATVLLALVMALYPLWLWRREKFAFLNVSNLIFLAAVWLTASLFNGYFRGQFNPFFNVMPHLIEVHNQTAPQAQGASGGSVVSYLNVLLGAVKNVPYHFGMREVPENLDYDVIRTILPILSLGPLFVMPFAVSGMVTSALLKRKNMTLLYIAVAALMLPLAARVPIGRYRLLMMPFFIIFAAIFIEELIVNRPKRLAMTGILIGVVGANLLCASPLVRSNPAAYHSLAIAAVKSRDDADSYFQKAWQMSNYTYKPSGIMLMLRFMQRGDFDSAEKTALQDKSNAPEFIFYHAVAKTARNRFNEARELLKKIKNPQKLGALYPKYQQLSAFLQTK